MGHRFEGHNLDDALNNATASLGVERYQLSHRVLVEKRGFLGGIKRVTIEVEVNENAAPPAVAAAPSIAIEEPEEENFNRPDLPPAGIVAPSRSSRGARGPRGGGRSGGGGGRARGGSRGGDDNRRGNRRGPKRYEDDVAPGDFGRFSGDVPEQGTESEAATAVRTWCEQVLGLAKLDAVVRTEENETQIVVRLYGSDTPRFTESHGELLDAIQVIANKALGGRKVEKDIELDCDGFKEHRVTDLEKRAKELAERVRQDGREQLLPAMSPIERRIVHLALQDDAAVTTESRGDGFYKRVAVILRPAVSSES
jgi:predicted RNA-binding protein Jag